MSLFLNGTEIKDVYWNGTPTTGYFNGSMVWGYQPPYQRYELNLFKSSNGLGTNTGNVIEPFSAFDEIGIRCSWESSRDTHGCNWLWFRNFTATTGAQDITFYIANSTNYYCFQSVFQYNNTAKTFNVPNDQSSQWWGMTTPITSNATIVAQNNASRHKIVAEIVGVKYQ